MRGRLRRVAWVLALVLLVAPNVAVPRAAAATGSISGTVFDDTDNSGTMGGGETGHFNATVFVDLNANGIADTGEPTVTTDASGSYSFSALDPGNYNVRVAPPTGFATTSPNPQPVTLLSGAAANNIDFGIDDSGVISGTTFNDANSNGTKDAGEAAMPSVTVYLDVNNNAALDPGELSTTSNGTGNWIFTGLPAGTYQPRLQLASGATQTTTAPSPVSVVAGSLAAGITFGVFTQGTISGEVYNDVNGNGTLDSGDNGLSGKTVYLDSNNNGSYNTGEPTTTTDSSGLYQFSNLTAGSYRPKVVVPPGSAVTSASPGAITVVSGTLGVANFALFQQGTITGTVYNDVNGDGVRAGGDNGIATRSVYLDANNNGVKDASETAVSTNSSGAYTFTGLSAGTYPVRLVSASVNTQTTPNPASVTVTSGTAVTGMDFGSFTYATITGTVYTDTNANGTKESTETGQTGRVVYLDTNNNGTLDSGEPNFTTGSTGSYTFSGLAAGTYYPKLVVPTGITQTSANPAPVTATSGLNATNTNFGLFSPAAISGTVFDDTNGNAIINAGEPGIAGATVYIDANSNGSLDAGEVTATTNASGVYVISNLNPGSYRIRTVVPGTRYQTTTNPANVSPLSGATTTNVNFGTFGLVSISGSVYDDSSGNGQKDAGDPGISGRTVYLDSNGNGSFDLGEPNTLTDGAGSYSFTGLQQGTYRPRIVTATGTTQTTASPTPISAASSQNYAGQDFGSFTLTTISGSVYQDVDGNGNRDAGDGGLAGKTVYLDTNNNGSLGAGEISVTTDGSGNYTFSNLGPGTYRPKVVVPSGNVQTSTNPTPVIAASGVASTGSDFALFTQASVSGTVFNDLNGNGVRDTGEAGIASRTVYVDSNANGSLDTGEPSALTTTNGSYVITGLGPGTYQLRQVVPSGSIQTSVNPAPVTTSSGSSTPNSDFGAFGLGAIGGTVYNDLNGNGAKTASESGVSGRTVYIDSNGNGSLDSSEPTAVTSSTGTYSFTGLVAGVYQVKFVTTSGTVQTSTDPGPITVVSGTNATGQDFGSYMLSSISGTIYDDTNGNASRTTGEPGISGRTVYLDANANSAFDPGEPTTTTDPNGGYVLSGVRAGTYRVRTVLPAGTIQTTPAPALITTTSGSSNNNIDLGTFTQGVINGTVYNDLNGNGVKDSGEPGIPSKVVYSDTNSSGTLNTGEPSTVTDANGLYSLSGLGTGTFKPRLQTATGFSVTSATPANVTVTSGLVANNVDFGMFFPATATGTVFTDTNGNGTQDAGEPAAGGRVVFDDVNGNGRKDLSEASATTNASGIYTLAGLGAGAHHFVTVPPTGQALTTPLLATNVTSGGTSAVNFGMRIPPPPVVAPLPPPDEPTGNGEGYWLAASDGGVFTYGSAQFYGSAGAVALNQPIVGMAAKPDGLGYWLVARDGGIFSYGASQFYGSTGSVKLNKPIVGMASTPTGKGYWLVASDGGIFSFGDAQFYGSTGSVKLNKPIVGMASTPTGKGYWLVASDGGIFSFGDAQFYGSTGSVKLNQPIVAMAPNHSSGYWLIAADGGVFSFGSAQFYGSAGSIANKAPIVSARAMYDGTGYYMFGADGSVYAYGSAVKYGEKPGLNAPIVDG